MRLSSVRIIAAVACLFFAAAAWRLSPHSVSEFYAQAQTAPAVQPALASQAASQFQPASDTVSGSAKPASIPDPQPVAAPGTELYSARRGEAIHTIAHRYLGQTSYLTSAELVEAIRATNHIPESTSIFKTSEQIVIPGILSAPITEKTIPIPKDFEVRAVYLTGIMADSDHGLRIIRHWREVGGNAVVFDIKDSDGSVSIPFEHPLVGKHNIYIHDLPKFIRFVHQRNMHAIARIAIFRDERLVVEHPELAVQSRANHTAWRENGKLVWTDPSNPKVQDYNIALAKYVAQLGVDEVQFDYVRFPAEGDQKDAQFIFQKEQPVVATEAKTSDSKSDVIPSTGAEAKTPDSKSDVILTTAHAVGGNVPQPPAQPQSAGSQTAAETIADQTCSGTAAESPTGRTAHHASRGRNVAAPKPCPAAKPRGPQRSDVITAFLKKAYAELHPTGALLSLDVFGVMAWQRPVDLSHTGQDIVGMARYCDVLSPMIYPSHFFGMDNIAHPGDEPAHFIGESMDRFMLITRDSGVVIRPWLQAFHWRTKTYSPEYIKIQVETAKAKGGVGFLFWNAGNDYSKPFIAMPEMKAANFKPESSSNDASGTKEDGKEPAKQPRYFRGDELPAPAVQASIAPATTAESGTH